MMNVDNIKHHETPQALIHAAKVGVPCDLASLRHLVNLLVPDQIEAISRCRIVVTAPLDDIGVGHNVASLVLIQIAPAKAVGRNKAASSREEDVTAGTMGPIPRDY